MQPTKEMVSKLLGEKIELAKNTLNFWEIAESASGEGIEYNKSWHPFRREDGTPLCGIRVYKNEIAYEELEKDKSYVSTTMEIYLTDKGDLVRFYTFEETFYSSKREKPRIQMKSIIAGDQLFSEDELQVILYKTTLFISYHYHDQKDNEKLADAVAENHRIHDFLWGWMKKEYSKTK